MNGEYAIPIPWMRMGYSGIAFTSLFLLYTIQFEKSVEIIIYGIGAIIGSYYFARDSITHILVKRKVTTDVIMTLAVICSAIIGALEESLTIVFLYSITETLESYTVRRTKTSIKSLIKLVPKYVNKVDGDSEISISIEEISNGDTIRIRVGDIIPTDGLISTGSTAIDESTITGEPIPAFKTVGDKVLSGTACSDGTFTYHVTSLPSESTVSKIIELVEEAQSKKVPVQLTIERFTRYYNPGILLFSVLIFIIPTILTSDVERWSLIAITLLVASAPCALAISSPVTMYSAISTAANKGILVKGGAFLESLGEVEAFVFDKTGTLTYGKPVLTDIIPVADINEAELLQIAGSLEIYSNHPLAKAVVTALMKGEIEKLDVKSHTTIPGVGINAVIKEENYFFGHQRDRVFDEHIEEVLGQYRREGKSVSYLLENDRIIGIFGFEDQVRETIVEAINELHVRDIPVFMMTGDNREAALRIGRYLGISDSNIFFSMSPDEKMEKVKALQQQYKLAMVGDGINDAPALALADIGIAMGIAGTDVSLETADIAIMSDDLLQLVKSINIGKQMKSTIIQNIIISTSILVGLLFGVLIGQVNITQAILIHEGTEVLIVANAMKLFFKSF